MMNERLDLEQEILSVWGVKEDIRRLALDAARLS
jgi:hypothetical protein